MIVVSQIQPPHSLLVVDASLNNRGFEYGLSDGIVSALQSKGMALTHNAALKPQTLLEFIRVFQVYTAFSALLLVTHGSAWRASTGAHLLICGEVYPWAFATALDLSIQDKLACLAICHGLNPGAGDSLIRGSNQALMLVGPDDILTVAEANAFFPPFLAALLRQEGVAWPAEFVEESVNEQNHYANNKMGVRVYV